MTLESTDLGIDTDFEFYQDNGSNVSNTIKDIELVVNTMETIYEAADIGITYEITTMIIRTTSSDPYTSSDAETLLNQFKDHWNTSPQTFIRRDTAQLFSGRNFSGSTIGIAWLGVICNVSSLGYSVVESKFTSNLTERAALSAHEVGHNWNADHCDGQPGCAIMCSVLGSCSGILTDFSDFEVDQIVGFKNSRTCLLDVPAAITPPFSDTFPSTTLSTTNWTYNFGGVVNSDGTNEPSASFSLSLDTSGSEEFRDDDVRTNFILLSGTTGVVLEYFSQHKGVENGEQFVVEYYATTREWLELERLTSNGVDETTYTFHSLNIPSLGLWNEFRVRFRPEANDSGDDWYIDNVSVSAGGVVDLTAPTPNPMTFAVPPFPAGTTSVSMVATTAIDADTPPVEYEFDFTILTPGGTDSGWQSSTSYTDTGLAVNTDYSYRVRARDSAETPNNTDFSATLSTATAIETPATAPILFGATSNSISMLSAQSYTNLLLGLSGVFFDSTTSGGDGGLNEWIQVTTETATGLAPDKLFTFQVKARNQLGVETSFSPTASMATLANVAGAPVLGGATCDSMTIDVVPNGNPSITTYSIQCTATSPNDPAWSGKFVSATGTPTATADFQTDAIWAVKTVTSLQDDTAYTFQVTSKNQEGVLSAASSSASLTTDDCTDPCELDTDGDGTNDCDDGCPDDPGKTSPGVCGCGTADTDSDGDGTANCVDACPNDPGKTEPGVCGCGVSDSDTDGDGTADCNDSCPDDPNKTDPGICGCGVSDADSDGDGAADCNDACAAIPTRQSPGFAVAG